MSGTDYYIPANYFDVVLEPGPDQKDILLVALLPSLEARTQENWDEFIKVAGWGRRIYLLIETTKHPTTALSTRLKTSEYMSGPFETVDSENNLEHRVPVGAGRFPSRRELFVARQGGEIAAIIECARDGEYPTPSCQHYFMAGDLRVKASYSKQFLLEWNSIQASVTALVQRYQHQ